MALTKKFRPISLKECDVTVYGGVDGTTLGTPVLLDAAQTVTVEPQADEVTLRGDDKIVETALTNKRVAVTMAAGGLPLEAVAAVTGGTLATSGTTPDQIKTLDVLGASAPPYVRVRGRQVLPDGVSDQVTTVHYVKFISGPSYGAADATFSTASFSGTGIPHPTNDKVVSWEQRETKAALAP